MSNVSPEDMDEFERQIQADYESTFAPKTPEEEERERVVDAYFRAQESGDKAEIERTRLAYRKVLAEV